MQKWLNSSQGRMFGLTFRYASETLPGTGKQGGRFPRK